MDDVLTVTTVWDVGSVKVCSMGVSSVRRRGGASQTRLNKGRVAMVSGKEQGGAWVSEDHVCLSSPECKRGAYL